VDKRALGFVGCCCYQFALQDSPLFGVPDQNKSVMLFQRLRPTSVSTCPLNDRLPFLPHSYLGRSLILAVKFSNLMDSVCCYHARPFRPLEYFSARFLHQSHIHFCLHSHHSCLAEVVTP
jgi:hypothetical protein